MVIQNQQGVTNLNVDLELLHDEMLIIAKHFDEFCSENKLDYFICGGSLLGAVRHGGFIPWDDDFDVAMPREDYQKFTEIWQDTERIQRISEEMPDYFKVSTPSKLHNPKYSIEEKYEFDNGMPRYNPYGIFIDIFPLDRYPDTYLGRFLNRYVGRILQTKAFSQFEMSKRPVSQRLIFKIFKLVPNKFLLFVRRKAEVLIAKRSASTFWGYGVETALSNLIADEELLFPTKKIEFSGLMLRAPRSTHGYLKMRFGDYMRLPDESDRQTHIASIKTKY